MAPDKETIRAVIDVLNEQQESDILIHARDLLHALDKGFLAYTADVPESAFVAKLRAAVARAEKRRAMP